MAVPTGEYELTARIDLSPVFGVLEHRKILRIDTPPPDLLKRRLADLKSDDPKVCRAALRDLRYFPKDGKRIVPAIVKLLKRDLDKVKTNALYTLRSYPEMAARYCRVYLRILLSDAPASERAAAGELLGRVAPKHQDIEKALVEGMEASRGYLKTQYERALREYRRRHRIPDQR